jgi:hypothetical protein
MRKIDVLSADDIDERVGAVHWLVPIRLRARGRGTTYSAGVVSGWLTPVAVVLTAAAVGSSVDRQRKPADRVG